MPADGPALGTHVPPSLEASLPGLVWLISQSVGRRHAAWSPVKISMWSLNPILQTGIMALPFGLKLTTQNLYFERWKNNGLGFLSFNFSLKGQKEVLKHQHRYISRNNAPPSKSSPCYPF